MSCRGCGGKEEASVANVPLCRRCAARYHHAGHDGATPLHVVCDDRPPYDDEAWMREHARRPDGSRPGSPQVEE